MHDMRSELYQIRQGFILRGAAGTNFPFEQNKSGGPEKLSLPYLNYSKIDQSIGELFEVQARL